MLGNRKKKIKKTRNITIQESHKLVFYTEEEEEEVFFRDLCAVQLLSNPASTDAVVVKAMRKGSFKGVDPMLSPLWCQWDKKQTAAEPWIRFLLVDM